MVNVIIPATKVPCHNVLLCFICSPFSESVRPRAVCWGSNVHTSSRV